MSRRFLGTTLAAVLLLATGCGGGESVDPAPTDAGEPSESTTTDTGADPTSDPTDEESVVGAPTWQDTGLDPEKPMTVGERWTAVTSEAQVTFTRNDEGGEPVTVSDDSAFSVSSVLLEGDTAVVGFAAGGEVTEGQAVRVDLPTGEVTEVVTPPVANGGAFARSGDSVWFPALGERDAYCLGTLAVTDMNGEQGWCAPQNSYFTGLTASAAGVGLLLLENGQRRQCRTAALLDEGGTPQPVEGPKDCKAWDIAATDTGFVWSEVIRESRQERARFFASVDGATTQLGIGSTGTLTPCGGSVFYASDPEGPDEPARLIAFDGVRASVAFESTSTGNAFLAKPECADGILTVSALGEAGDQQVFAPVD